mmetsp:Transcript_24394/g.37093  ORF Transcript_24394/g.37093 Transcript_24394/m.37093 type:complete len:83 (+) Transcript_24394:270-518(+)
MTLLWNNGLGIVELQIIVYHNLSYDNKLFFFFWSKILTCEYFLLTKERMLRFSLDESKRVEGFIETIVLQGFAQQKRETIRL